MDEVKVKQEFEDIVDEQRLELSAAKASLHETRAQNAKLLEHNAQMQGQISTLMAQMQEIMARQAQPQHLPIAMFGFCDGVADLPQNINFRDCVVVDTSMRNKSNFEFKKRTIQILLPQICVKNRQQNVDCKNIFYSTGGEKRPMRMRLVCKNHREQNNNTIKEMAPLGFKIDVCHAVQSRQVNFADVTLGRIIGEGAFGKVHEGTWRDHPVAVKLLICQDLGQDILEEFQSEVKIMSALRHPNICRLLGSCMEPPYRCLVVELLPRGSLWNVLRASLSINELMRIRFINDTAKGMSYLHNFQPPILHRDLKSQNLLVDHDYAIRISDFGLSRVKEHVQTMTGNCGTVEWMAPEVLDCKKYTEKADVFSFGIVMWECITGDTPYKGMNKIQAALGVLNRNLRPVVPKTCPPLLAKLMKSCWARDPEHRPSFIEIVSALRSVAKTADPTKLSPKKKRTAKDACIKQTCIPLKKNILKPTRIQPKRATRGTK